MNDRSLSLFDKLAALLCILQISKFHILTAENSEVVCPFDNTGNSLESNKNEIIIGKDGIIFYYNASNQADVLKVQWILINENDENLNSPCPKSKIIANRLDRNNNSVFNVECKVDFIDRIPFLTTSLKILLYGDNGNNTFLICKSKAFIFSGQWNLSQDVKNNEYHCILNEHPTNETYIVWTMRAFNGSFTKKKYIPCCSSEASSQETVYTYNECNPGQSVCKIKLNETAIESMDISGHMFLRCSDPFVESIGSKYIKIDDGQAVTKQPSGYPDILIRGILLCSVVILLMFTFVILMSYGLTLPAVNPPDKTSYTSVAEFDVYDVIEDNTEWPKCCTMCDN